MDLISSDVLITIEPARPSIMLSTIAMYHRFFTELDGQEPVHVRMLKLLLQVHKFIPFKIF